MKMHECSRSICLSLGLAILLVAGCASKTTVPEPEPTCENLVWMQTVAYNALADKLYEYLNANATDPQVPNDVDFQTVHDLYASVHECSPSDQTSRFGLALCDLLSLSANAEVNAAFNEWDAYLDAHSPFKVPGKAAAPLSGLLGLPRDSGALQLPFDLVSRAALVNLKAMSAGEPQVANVQRILRDVILPRVNEAIDLLGPVGDDAAFQFEVSGRMQGDLEEMSREIDQTDVLAMRAALHLLAAGLKVATAYNVQFASYDDAGMQAGLEQSTGNIMKLTTTGASQMQAVPSDVLAAVNDLDHALTALEAETDNQNDDVIKIGPDGASQADLDEIQTVHLPDVRNAFAAGGIYYSADWDSRSYTPDTSLKIDLHAFFSNPIADWKQMLPPYSLAITEVPGGYGGYYWDYAYGGPFSVFVPVGYTASYRSYRVTCTNHVVSSTSEYGLFPAYKALCDQYVAASILDLNSSLKWDGYAVFHFYDYSSVTAGTTNNMYYTVEYNYSLLGDLYYAPEVTWGASSFSLWCAAIPDPTFSGLLPEMDSGYEFTSVFGLTEGEWEPTVVWNWYNSLMWKRNETTNGASTSMTQPQELRKPAKPVTAG